MNPRSSFRSVFLTLLIFSGLGSPISLLATSIDEVQVGVAGAFKLGHWTPVHVTVSTDIDQAMRLEVTLLDGDGVPAVFGESIQLKQGQSREVTVYVRAGRRSSGLEVVALGKDSRQLDAKHLTLPDAMLSTDYWLMLVGAELPLKISTLRRSLAAGAHLRITHLHSLAELPDHWQGLDGVDQLVLTSSQPSYTESAGTTPDRLDVLTDWLHAGGRVLLSCGRRGMDLYRGDDRWRVFFPGRVEGTLNPWQTGGLEDYAGASQRLRIAPGADTGMTVLADVDGVIDAFDGVGGTGNRPMIVRRSAGLGQLVFLAVDLDVPPLSGWEAQQRLVEGLLRETDQVRAASQSSGRTGRVAHVGYTDLAGQLRAALDRFEGVTLVNFYWVAGILLVYLLAIGPMDYFLVRRFGRPSWTWLTYPTLVLVFSGIAVWMAGQVKQRQVRVNQLEIVDLDLASGQLRGTSWIHYYNPSARTVDLSLQWGGLQQAGLAEEHIRDQRFSWQGLPGSGLGGLATRAGGVVRQRYRHGQTGQIHGLPMAAASTRSLVATVEGRIETEVKASLVPDRLAAELRGTFSNPLAVTLEDAVLYYGDLSFQLDGPLLPGQQVDALQLADSMRNVESRLTRGRAGGRQPSGGWSQEEFDVSRLAEMLMFHQAAGGSNYTQLTHRYQPWLDLSPQLELGRAVLVGRSMAAATQLDVEGTAVTPSKKWTYYRVLIPVSTSPSSQDGESRGT